MFIFSNCILFCHSNYICPEKMGVLASQMTIDYPINLANEINKLLDNHVILSQFCPIIPNYNPDFMTYTPTIEIC